MYLIKRLNLVVVLYCVGIPENIPTVLSVWQPNTFFSICF